jgi:hypothetical protein
MTSANAEKHKRGRDKRNACAKQADQQKVTDAILADALEPLLEGLFLEGHTHAAAASPSTVANLVCQLERLLVANGIVPQSKRSEDPQAYARNLQRAEDQTFREEFKAQCRRDSEERDEGAAGGAARANGLTTFRSSD